MSRLPIVFARLAIAGGLCLCACSAQQSAPSDDSPDASDITQSGTGAGNTASLPPSSTTSGNAADAASPTAAATDAGTAKDASTSLTDASATDAAPDSGLLPVGAACLLPIQCANLLCLPFKGKGLRCTKACTKDSDCPNNKNCGDDPAVCDI